MVCSIACDISRVALHKRFTKSAVTFIQKVVQLILQIKNPLKLKHDIFQPFSAVLLIDSSWIVLSKKLSKKFPGFGGVTSEATAKIQLAFDFLKGSLSFFDITAGTKNDASYSLEIVSKISQKMLIITDLGYYSAQFFKLIDEKKAFFISRFRSTANMYHPKTGKKINIFKLLKKLKKDRFCININIGKGFKTGPYRLIGLKVSKKISNERRRKRRLKAKRNKEQVRKSTLQLCDWTLILTNTKEEQLAAEKVLEVYKLRWQIELIFKQFKSVLEINNINTTNENRFLCELYGKLALAIILTKIYGINNCYEWNRSKREISFDKFCKRIIERILQFCHIFINVGFDQALEFFQKELNIFLPECIKTTQKSKETSLELLIFSKPKSVFSYSDKFIASLS